MAAKFETSVNKAKLLERLCTRHNKYSECYIEALDAFWEKERDYLEAQLLRVKDEDEGYIKNASRRPRRRRKSFLGCRRSSHPTVDRPPIPINSLLVELDQAIEMVDAHDLDTFVLSEWQFESLWKGAGEDYESFEEHYTELTGKDFPE